MNNSVKLKRHFNHFLTYLYLVVLSVIIIYPLLITITSAFKTGNIVAFKLDFNIDWSFDNFSRLFSETLYGTWYLNTVIIAVLTMIVQTSIVVLAGYAYSRYNFIARKQSLVFFLIIQMVPVSYTHLESNSASTSLDNSSSVIRHCQLPPIVDGKFILAEPSNSSRSCMVAIAI